MFKLNNDLKEIKVNWYNVFHLIITCVMAVILKPYLGIWGCFISYGIMILWDIGDGFKPHYSQAFPQIKNAKFLSWNWFKKVLFYADGCSLQDIFFWDLIGFFFGIVV